MDNQIPAENNTSPENTTAPSQMPTIPLQPTNSSRKNGLNLKLIFLFVFAVVLLILVAIFITRSPKTQTTPQNSENVNPPAEVTSAPSNVWTLYSNKRYFYSIQLPPRFVKQTINNQEDGVEEYVEFVKSGGDNPSKIRILMTSSVTQKNEITQMRERLKDTSMNEEIGFESDTISKIYISNFTAFKRISNGTNYSRTLLVEKDKWIYQFSLESNLEEDKQLFDEVESKIIIYDSAAQYFIDNPE